jgi:NADPH:quinone reductase-like Zn-dependent oxidoreductase
MVTENVGTVSRDLGKASNRDLGEMLPEACCWRMAKSCCKPPGLLKPKHGIPGFDVAGQVEAVGTEVSQFRPGDEVFGACHGACVEYVCVGQDKLALKPANLTFAEAAALPTSALAALHALRDVGKVRPGQKVLIDGASGGIGTFAVQIARSFGADVTGVCGTRNADMVRSVGADHVIDYTQFSTPRQSFTLSAASF